MISILLMFLNTPKEEPAAPAHNYLELFSTNGKSKE